MSTVQIEWLCLMILGGRGGIGKTTIAMLLAVALLLRRRVPSILEADIQRRLELLFPRMVQPIDIDQTEALAEDPLALARSFQKILATAREVAKKKDADLIMDSAATWHTPILRYCREAAVPRKIKELGGRLIFVVPVTADADSVLLGVDTGLKIEALLPSAEIVFVLNEHPSKVRFDLPVVESTYGIKSVNELLSRHKSIHLKAISPKIWRPFELANLSPQTAATASPASLAKLLGEDIDTAEIMQGKVRGWLNAFVAEVAPILTFRRDSDVGADQSQ